uniref:Uncharacterized protein n=1 Tax=viral metagenome TaxID=1070528 RepID=A0A6C0JV21_9ZZZZ
MSIRNNLVTEGEIIMMMHFNDYRCIACNTGKVRLYRLGTDPKIHLPVCKRCSTNLTTNGPYICGFCPDTNIMTRLLPEWQRFPENN